MNHNPLPIDYNGADTPHGIIEVNGQCNISCRACYKKKNGNDKPMKLIIEEFHFMLSSRRIDQITIAGGEPTLHPDIVDIIRYFRHYVTNINMLSNGYAYSPALLDRMREAGLSCIHVHVDEMQKRPDAPGCEDCNDLRDKIGSQLAGHGITPALSVTLYKSGLRNFTKVFDYFYSNRYSHSFLVTLCTDFIGLGKRLRREMHDTRSIADDELSMSDFEAFFSEHYGMSPDFYVASNLDRKKRKWVFYNTFSFTDREGRVRLLQGSRGFNLLFMLMDRLSLVFRGKRLFDIRVDQEKIMSLFLSSIALSASRSYRKKAKEFRNACKKGNYRMYYKKLYIQEGPSVTADGKLEVCRSCPDATVKNGRLVPVCLADIIDDRFEIDLNSGC